MYKIYIAEKQWDSKKPLYDLNAWQADGLIHTIFHDLSSLSLHHPALTGSILVKAWHCR